MKQFVQLYSVNCFIAKSQSDRTETINYSVRDFLCSICHLHKHNEWQPLFKKKSVLRKKLTKYFTKYLEY